MTSSEQARADAMADAETLRLYCGVNLDDPEATAEGSYLGEVARLAEIAQFRLSLMHRHEDAPKVTSAWHASVLSARAAFRAVPALRGED